MSDGAEEYYEPGFYPEDDDEDFDCSMDSNGDCGAAGSEECEFECPYNKH